MKYNKEKNANLRFFFLGWKWKIWLTGAGSHVGDRAGDDVG